jgi:hypothetical protein
MGTAIILCLEPWTYSRNSSNHKKSAEAGQELYRENQWITRLYSLQLLSSIRELINRLCFRMLEL